MSLKTVATENCLLQRVFFAGIRERKFTKSPLWIFLIMKKTYKADLTKLEEIAQDTQTFCELIDADGASCFALNLCLDEIFTNIVQYGYKSDASKDIEIEYTAEPNESSAIALRVYIRDCAPAFNPLTQVGEPDVVSGVEEREVGGLGVFFLKKNMDELEYSRKKDVNELMMLRHLKK